MADQKATKDRVRCGEARQPQEANRLKDPFLYFSDDEVRMQYLKLEKVPDRPIQPTLVRKKRLSFELHPHVLLEDIFADGSLDESDVSLDKLLEALGGDQ